MRTSLLFAAAIALAAPAAASAAPAPRQVRVDGGQIQGVVQDGVLAFKGVPFAAPPVGELRWRPPQPVRAWSGVRPATAYGHDCMQKPFPGDAAPLGTAPAEDCLVLNVWRPAQARGRKLPVMVWIYGGGFVNGGSSPAVYSGAPFAKTGVVFVSFNYRLGRFGFFAFPALTREHPDEPKGDYGYMDQIAALKWVQRNIAAFGGDPANVTVFGESAGGGSVHTLLTSPMSRGLFQKAIIESGGGRAPLMGMVRLSVGTPGQPSAEEVGVAFAKAHGIEGTDAAALAKLRALSAEEVTGGLDMGTMMRDRATYSAPIVDGRIVVESPEIAYRSGRFLHVPLIIGANSVDIGFGFEPSKQALFASFGKAADQARAAYDPDGSVPLSALRMEVAADRLMVEPARFTAAAFAAHGAPAYEYRFSYVAGSLAGPNVKGAQHATEIPYVFDTVKAKYGDKLTPTDAAVARTMNAYWANFAKTGDPNGPGLPHWPRYDARSDQIVDFAADGVAGPGPDPWKPRLDAVAAAEAAQAP